MTRKKDIDFESALKQLEALVHKMENQTLSLEEALSCFEEGVTLTKQCQKALQEAEQKVIKITQGALINGPEDEAAEQPS